MRITLAFLALCLFTLVGLGVTGVANAAPPSDATDVIIPEPTPVVANDFHIRYYNTLGKKMRPTSHLDGPFTIFSAVPTGLDSTTWDCTWSGGVVAIGTKVPVGVTFPQVQACNQLKKTNMYWTFNGTQVGPTLVSPGFDVTPANGPATAIAWKVRNDGPGSMTIRGLQFKMASRPVRALLEMVDSSGVGWDAARSDFTLAAGDSQTFSLPGDAYSYNYLRAQGSVLRSGVWSGRFSQEHQHLRTEPVPAATTWGLIVLSLALLSAGFVAIRRSRRTQVA